MFAREHKQEYDPSSSPMIERPLATGRPLSVQVQGNAYGGNGLDGLRKENHLENSKIPVYSPPRSPTKFNGMPEISNTPSKAQLSPGKSSLSAKSKFTLVPILDAETGDFSEDDEGAGDHELPPGKSLHRYAKSVTFDAAPPQINEYEMTTPDPSSVASGSREGSYESVENEEEDSFDRGGSIEREDSFDESLEDTDKTPVVLPEDWRFMSPAMANDDLAAELENPFDGDESSPAPTARPSSAVDASPSPKRTDSANSNGERRPLPPLPALDMPIPSRTRSNSVNSLSVTVERVSNTQRVTTSPFRPASISKSEIQDMAGCSLSLEDRLRLMMMEDEKKAEPPSELGAKKDFQESSHHNSPGPEEQPKDHQFTIYEDDVAGLGEYKPPRISRESILRKVKSRSQLVRPNEYDDFSPGPSPQSSRARLSDLDPDTPIPSLEAEPISDDDASSVYIKQQDDEGCDFDIHSKALDPIEAQEQLESTQENATSLPQFSSMLEEQDFGFGLDSFLTPSPPVSEEPVKTSHSPASAQIEQHIERCTTPEAQLEPPRWPGQGNDTDEEPRTPDSVVRHPIADSPLPESPSVPEPIATIKAPEGKSGKLKTRPSMTPADVQTMAETRRQVSREIPMVPPIPEKHQNRPSVIAESDASALGLEALPGLEDQTEDQTTNEDSLKQTKRKSSFVQLEIPIARSEDGLGFGLDQEFDRVIEAQKVALNFSSPSSGPQTAEFTAGQGFGPVALNAANRPFHTQKGYVMRQNTKIIIASSASCDSATDTNESGVRGTRSAGNSPRKPSQPHPWTTEPWNGKTRRKSLRQSGGSPQKKSVLGAAPPLPGQQSNMANGLGSVTEDEVMLKSEETDDKGERGILFVKVVCVKDLDLPLPKGMVFCLFFVWSLN